VSDEIQAAGGVVARDGQVLVVHRPRYSDWSLPKGKLDPGETWEQAALREVEEEAGVSCRLVRELPPVTYDHKGRPKRVRYWLMEPNGEEPPFEANDEVDEVRWLGIEDALELLSYERDRTLLRGLKAST
jgi:8-oxo-dGTP diphosphatase